MNRLAKFFYMKTSTNRILKTLFSLHLKIVYEVLSVDEIVTLLILNNVRKIIILFFWISAVVNSKDFSVWMARRVDSFFDWKSMQIFHGFDDDVCMLFDCFAFCVCVFEW